jgi:glycogen synthase
MEEPRWIFFMAREVISFARIGGLGDVTSLLSKALATQVAAVRFSGLY